MLKSLLRAKQGGPSSREARGPFFSRSKRVIVLALLSYFSKKIQFKQSVVRKDPGANHPSKVHKQTKKNPSITFRVPSVKDPFASQKARTLLHLQLHWCFAPMKSTLAEQGNSCRARKLVRTTQARYTIKLKSKM